MYDHYKYNLTSLKIFWRWKRHGKLGHDLNWDKVKKRSRKVKKDKVKNTCGLKSPEMIPFHIPENRPTEVITDHSYCKNARTPTETNITEQHYNLSLQKTDRLVWKAVIYTWSDLVNCSYSCAKLDQVCKANRSSVD